MWSSMTDRERDAALHKSLHHRHNVEGEVYCDGEHEKNEGCDWRPLPTYSTSFDAVRMIEDEIEKRGMQREYLHQLVGMQQGSVALDIDCLDYEGTMPRALWSLVCATPAQRAEAAYRVLREAS